MKTSLRELLEMQINVYLKELYVLNEMKEDLLHREDYVRLITLNTDISRLYEVIADLKKLLR